MAYPDRKWPVDLKTRHALSRFTVQGLELICYVHPHVPSYLIGDPGRLRQIILNLATNAVKFTDRGQVAIEVNVVHLSRRQAELRFDIRDTGIGIPADRIGGNVICDG